jgi:hypothetical protein
LAAAAASLLIVLRMYVLLPDPIVEDNWALTGAASLAIWNMNKIVIAIATSAWGTTIIFQIQSKPLSTFRGSSEVHFKRAMVLVIVRVNDQLLIAVDLLDSSIPRSALNRYLETLLV